MRRRNQQTWFAYTAALGFSSVVVALFLLLAKAENFNSISSVEIDRMLYTLLDGYERTFEESPELSRLLTMAITDPGEMTASERHEYVSRERRFFGGWEAAFEYSVSGHLDANRFEVWDRWYVGELRRRPAFAWEANREHFSQGFAEHVDRALQDR